MGEPAVSEPTFDLLPLGEDVRRAIDAMGYKTPTPVQRAVYEPAVRGKSLVVQARTGTGKTAAFGLPLVDQLVKKSEAVPQALILCPTRELALQVNAELVSLSQFRKLSVLAVYGGASMTKQVEGLSEGAHIIVGTPGRVLDHIRRGTLRTEGIRVLVLDEADEMLSMGFARELHAIIETLPEGRQGLYFSATIPPDVERLATTHLTAPEFITLSSDQVGALEIEHYVYLLPKVDKKQAFLRILAVENPESAIVFCNTKDETERTAESLKQAGYNADWLNGDLDQRERERVMTNTREGKLRFLVATDVAARGIDISHLTHVINYDFPESTEAYVHRTGRTGRAGRTGTAISLVLPGDIGNLYMLRLTYKIRPLEKQLPSDGDLRTRREQDLVDFVAEAFAHVAPQAEDVEVARRILTHDQADKIVAGLLRAHLGPQKGESTALAEEARKGRLPKPVAGSGDEPQSGVQPAATPEARRPRERREPVRERREPRERGALKGRRPGIGWTESPAHIPASEGAGMPQGDEQTPEGAGGFVRLFVNVGKRDGVGSEDLLRFLEGKVAREDTSDIHVRDRMAFVSIRKEHADAAIQALAGQVVGGRSVVAEHARPR